jgi:hypothetical protein
VNPEAFHLTRAYELCTLSWAAAVQTGNPAAIEAALEALNAVKQARRHAATPDDGGAASFTLSPCASPRPAQARPAHGDAGARNQGDYTSPPEGERKGGELEADSFSLSDLAALHSLGPDITNLRALLGQALTLAERIDEARGRSYPEPVGGSCGWDLAEEVNQLLARVEIDGVGAPGKGLE